MNEVKYLKEQINTGRNVEFCKYSAHTISSLLKMYFRELPEPLMTFEYYDIFIAAQCVTEEDARLEKIRKVISYLPASHRILLARLFAFLHRVADRSDLNKMRPANLAICFAPNLLRPPVESPDIVIGDSPHANSLIATLITHSDYFFGGHDDSEKDDDDDDEDDEHDNTGGHAGGVHDDDGDDDDDDNNVADPAPASSFDADHDKDENAKEAGSNRRIARKHEEGFADDDGDEEGFTENEESEQDSHSVYVGDPQDDTARFSQDLSELASYFNSQEQQRQPQKSQQDFCEEEKRQRRKLMNFNLDYIREEFTKMEKEQEQRNQQLIPPPLPSSIQSPSFNSRLASTRWPPPRTDSSSSSASSSPSPKIPLSSSAPAPGSLLSQPSLKKSLTVVPPPPVPSIRPIVVSKSHFGAADSTSSIISPPRVPPVDTEQALARIKGMIAAAAKNLEFERAAMLRDKMLVRLLSFPLQKKKIRLLSPSLPLPPSLSLFLKHSICSADVGGIKKGNRKIEKLERFARKEKTQALAGKFE